jgi:hypothetical protein
MAAVPCGRRARARSARLDRRSLDGSSSRIERHAESVSIWPQQEQRQLSIADEWRRDLAAVVEHDLKGLAERQRHVVRRAHVRREARRVERGIEQRSPQESPFDHAAVTQAELQGRSRLEDQRLPSGDHSYIGSSSIRRRNVLQNLSRVGLRESDRADPYRQQEHARLPRSAPEALEAGTDTETAEKWCLDCLIVAHRDRLLSTSSVRSVPRYGVNACSRKVMRRRAFPARHAGESRASR